MLWDGLEPLVQYMLALALSAYWLLNGLSRAYERIVTVHTAATRSRRDADRAAAMHRDTHISGMIDTAEWRRSKDREGGK